ncbi:MAG: LysR family transcriptional regulator [Betaproteobacteria bacterium]|nr:LysR family transcriptional regulator [Betaproteobacteria bacterium]
MTEGSVTRAAARLRRTPSAISHSLARLRDQIGDPLLVKVGTCMAPSPFARKLVEDVRPILRSIQRVVAPPEPFDPATSTRLFRIAIADFAPTLLPKVIADVQRRAPGVRVEWLAPNRETMSAVAESQVDLALVAASVAMPEGVLHAHAGALHSVTFARRGHPAIASWGTAAWSRWPHIQVHLGEGVRSMVEHAAEEHRLTRVIGASLPNFSQIPALLSQSNLLATMTPLVVDDAMDRFDLCALEPPIPIKASPFSFVWSFRLESDPGSRWLRGLVKDAFSDIQRSVHVRTSGRNLIKSRGRKR